MHCWECGEWLEFDDDFCPECGSDPDASDPDFCYEGEDGDDWGSDSDGNY